MRNLRDELRVCWQEAQTELPAAWRSALSGAEPDFGAVPETATLESTKWVVPVQRAAGGPFYALDGIDPEDVSVVVVGDDPDPDPMRAARRSFEQRNLHDWEESLARGRVAPSLVSLARAAAALHPATSWLGLDGTSGRRDRFQDRLDRGLAVLPNPRAMFENLTGQGVLWLNRTPTISTQSTGSGWQAIEAHRGWHRALWRPITRAILSAVVKQAIESPIVFGLFGYRAKQLRRQIESLGRRSNLRFVTAGHPSVPHLFFRGGNPLARINVELSSQGRDPIDWCGPGAIPARGIGRAANVSLGGASARSIAIMDRTVGKYRKTLRRLAER